MSDELKFEMFAIASVHSRNKEAYGGSSVQAGLFLKTGLQERGNTKMKLANAAVINVLNGGFDYSYGATMWGGAEQSQFPDSDKRFSTGGKRSWEIHKNTIGWSISDSHFSKWKTNVGKSFQAPQISYTPSEGKGRKYYLPNTIRLKSTAVYGQTIFWKELSGKSIIKKDK